MDAAVHAAIEPRVRLPSFMSHSPAISRALHDAWVELFVAVGGGRTLVLAAAPLIDVASLAVFRSVAARAALELLIDDDVARPEELHAGRSFDLGHTELSSIFAGLGRGEPVSVEVMAAAHEVDERDLGDASAWRASLTRCFDLQGFAAVLSLGERLERFAASLDRPALAEVHTLIGLSAYARHVESSNSERIGEFMAEHFMRALEFEPDGVRRAALRQRMSMVEARRRGRTEAARGWAEAAVAEARAHEGDAAAFVLAWSLNALAYVHARSGALELAGETMDEAFERLLAIRLDSPALPRGERTLSELAFADNRVELALLAEDRARALVLSSELCERERALEGESFLANVRRVRLLASVPERTRECLELARETARAFAHGASPIDELECRSWVADAAERLGLWSEAAEAHARCLALRTELASEAACDATRLRWAKSLWRSGRAAQARVQLVSSIELTPEALALLARITAELEGRSAAEQVADQAIDAATELGDARTVVRVSLGLIDVCEVIGDAESAAILIDEARRTIGEFGDSVTPGLRGQLAAICGDPTVLGERFDLDEALREPELWQHLPALARVLARAGRDAEATRCRSLAQG